MQKPATQLHSSNIRTLDARTLGRPVHLLQKFVAPLQEDLAQIFRTGLNRRYRAAFEVGEVLIQQLTEAPTRCRWLSFASETGRIGVAIERHLLLCILEYRYGAPDASTTKASSDGAMAAMRETATEERLASMLGRQFVSALAERIEWLPDANNMTARQHEFSESSLQPPRPGTWAVRAAVAEPTHGIEGAVWFTLDDAWMQRLFSRIAPARKRSRDQLGNSAPLAARLNMTLIARLLEKRVSLGMLLDTRVGDVIPVSLSNTDVLIDDSRVFTARVAEHKGKLCLTAFEDVE